MKEFRNGDRVKIHTKTAGSYDGQIGTVFHKTSTIPRLVHEDRTGFIRYSAIFEGCYDVKFDHCVDIGDHTMVPWNMFYPNELEKLEERGMTYDDAVNKIVERYRNGDFPGWVMTDPDYAQMRRDLGNGTYEFIELFSYTDGTVALHHEEIDLNDYELADVLFYGSFYHENQDELLGQPREILSEYMFEQTCSMEGYGFTPEMFDEYLKIVKEE